MPLVLLKVILPQGMYNCTTRTDGKLASAVFVHDWLCQKWFYNCKINRSCFLPLLTAAPVGNVGKNQRKVNDISAWNSPLCNATAVKVVQIMV